MVLKKYHQKIKNLVHYKIFDFTKKYLVLFKDVNVI
jgi:hypothetical protein